MRKCDKRPGNTAAAFFSACERGICMLMFMATAIALLFLSLTLAAAREDERMGIRFEGEGVKHRDQS